MIKLTKTNRRSVLALSLSAVLASLSGAALAGEPIINLSTTEAGIHEVTHASLLNSGVDLSGVSTAELALVSQGQPVPIQVVGGNSQTGTFGAGASIRFIAHQVDTLYTDTNVYALELVEPNSQPARINDQATPMLARVPFANSYLATEAFAPQSNYSFTSPKASDPWYAKRMVAVGQPMSETFNMTLSEVAPGGNDGLSGAKMSVDVWGATNLPGPGNDHHVKVSLNGRELVAGQFDGLQAKSLNAPLEGAVTGTNQVKITLPMDTGFGFDAVNVNKIEMTYPRRFMAEDNVLNFASRQQKFRVQGLVPNDTVNGKPVLDAVVMREDANGNVVHVTNARARCRSTCRVELGGTGQLANYYVAASDKLQQAQPTPLPLDDDITSGNARYLIISHPDFIGSNGNNALEALATELQSEMGSVAIVDVQSIYAQFGHHLFDPQAIRDYINFSHANRGTEYVLLVGGDVYDYRQFENQDATSFIPSLYAATGNNVTFAPVDAKYVDLDDDNVPDLPIARLPVRTTGQLEILLAKREAYVNRDYQGTALLVADQYDDVQQYDFGNDANEIEAEYLQGFDVQKAYVDELGTSQARQKVRDQINQGTTLTAFFGHSSTNQWSFNGLFTGPDAAGLSNQGKPTVVTQWGCWNAYYVSPNEDSMGHRFMMEGDRGAVAVMGASTLTNANSERELARLVFERLANGERLGDAVTNAKQDYAQDNPNDLDVLLGWTVLGLPELLVN